MEHGRSLHLCVKVYNNNNNIIIIIKTVFNCL